MDQQQVTQLLQAFRAGDAGAEQSLFPKIYEELRRVARSRMRQERPGHTLQATALVHEVYLKLAGSEQSPTNRTHFLALSARAMRRILVDHARTRSREKRGGGYAQVTLSEHLPEAAVTQQGLLELDDALAKLACFDDRAARALELMFFGGLTYDEIGETLGLGRTSVFNDIQAAKAWLAVEMAKG